MQRGSDRAVRSAEHRPRRFGLLGSRRGRFVERGGQQWTLSVREERGMSVGHVGAEHGVELLWVDRYLDTAVGKHSLLEQRAIASAG